MKVHRTYRKNGKLDRVYFYNEDESYKMICEYDEKTEVESKRWIYEDQTVKVKYFKPDSAIIDKIEIYDKSTNELIENNEPSVKIFGDYGKIIEEKYARNSKLYTKQELVELESSNK